MKNPDNADKKIIRSIYNKKRYEENKEEILKYRRERYKKMRENNKNIIIKKYFNNKNIIVIQGESILHFG